MSADVGFASDDRPINFCIVETNLTAIVCALLALPFHESDDDDSQQGRRGRMQGMIAAHIDAENQERRKQRPVAPVGRQDVAGHDGQADGAIIEQRPGIFIVRRITRLPGNTGAETKPGRFPGRADLLQDVRCELPPVALEDMLVVEKVEVAGPADGQAEEPDPAAEIEGRAHNRRETGRRGVRYCKAEDDCRSRYPPAPPEKERQGDGQERAQEVPVPQGPGCGVKRVFAGP